MFSSVLKSKVYPFHRIAGNTKLQLTRNRKF